MHYSQHTSHYWTHSLRFGKKLTKFIIESPKYYKKYVTAKSKHTPELFPNDCLPNDTLPSVQLPSNRLLNDRLHQVSDSWQTPDRLLTDSRQTPYRLLTESGTIDTQITDQLTESRITDNTNFWETPQRPIKDRLKKNSWKAPDRLLKDSWKTSERLLKDSNKFPQFEDDNWHHTVNIYRKVIGIV